jgi:hypothetical protein
MKEHRERHWDDKTVGDVVSEIAAENGLTPQVSAAAGAHTYKWLGQQGESALHFVERLAKRHNALFAVKDGKLLFVDKGSGQSASGAALGMLIVTPPMIIKGSCSVNFGEREDHKKVRAAYHDTKAAERKYVEAESDPEGEVDYTLRHPYADKDEAETAAGSKAKALQRAQDSTTVTIEGNVAARGGGPMAYAGVHPEIDGLKWIIETADHTYTKNGGYQTKIDAKAKI